MKAVEETRRTEMKVVVAMDSFKGSVTSLEAGYAVKEGIHRVDESIEVIVKPLADGGEGTVQALTQGLMGEFFHAAVTGPEGETVRAAYGIAGAGTGKIAIMEMAEAAGITLLRKEKDPWKATTYGVGEMILDAIEKGCRQFILGIGGSATNDAGAGMLQALGFSLLDKTGQPIGRGAAGLAKLAVIEDKNVPKAVRECSFQVACDVENPLCGSQGATYIFGAQKGVKETEKEQIDKALLRFAGKVCSFTGRDYSMMPGAGAAGGLGFALLSFLNARLQPGIQLVMNAVGLEEAIKTADYVITGEGCIDAQTSMGKAPAGIAELAQKYGAGVIALAGVLGDGARENNKKGIDACFSVMNRIQTLEETMEKENTVCNIADTSEQIFRVIACAGRHRG